MRSPRATISEAGIIAVRRAVGIGAVTAMNEASSLGKMWSTALQIALPLCVTVLLWRGLYAATPVVAGVPHDQAVTYAVLAALLTYLRTANRTWFRDAVVQHVHTGTIVYWFLRPISPARYHLLRAAGDLAYSLAWVLPAYAVCLATGAVTGPADPVAGAWAAVSFIFGQVIVYLIGLLLDLSCFWTLVNEQIIRMVGFIQTLLSGGFAPLWFFPDWFQTLSQLLPFQAIVNIPMSVYTGRIHGEALWWNLALQSFWCVLLGVAAAVLWPRAASRLEVQGG